MSKKLKKQLRNSRRYGVDQETVEWVIIHFICFVFVVVCAGGTYLWKWHLDSKVQANVEDSVTDVQAWSKLYPDTEVPTKTVRDMSGLIGERQFTYSPYDDTESNENTPHSVHIYVEGGNVIAVQPGNSVGAYTICGFHPVSMHFPSADRALVYDSSTGATESGVPCPLTLTREPLFSSH